MTDQHDLPHPWEWVAPGVVSVKEGVHKIPPDAHALVDLSLFPLGTRVYGVYGNLAEGIIKRNLDVPFPPEIKR